MLLKKEPLLLALALLGLIYLGSLVIGVTIQDRPEVGSAPPGDGYRPITPEEEATASANTGQELATNPVNPIEFVNVAEDVGINFTHSAFRWGFSGDPIAMMGGGLCWLDYDNNGWMDLYVVNSYALAEAGIWQSEEGGLPTSSLFANTEGQFTDVSADSGTNLEMRGNGCVAADLNQDGWTDIYVTTSRANLLLLNQKDGTFEEVAQMSGSYAYGWQTGVSIGDINRDGLPDLFVSGYVDINNRIEGATMGFPNTHYGLRDLLFINQGSDETGIPIFEEVGELVNLEPAGTDPESDFEYGLGSLMTDIDGDGDLDILVANDTNPNRLYLNEPAENDLGFQFVESGAVARINDINSGMGVASGDIDGDGSFDLFITNLGHQTHSIYQNDGRPGIPAFLDVADELGVGELGVGITGWGTIWADFDNDTDLDLFTVNGHVPVLGDDEKMPIVYYASKTAQGEAAQLSDLSNETGLARYGDIHGRGAATADFDNDGDLDIAITQVGGEVMLLENRQTTMNSVMITFPNSESAGAVIVAILPNGQSLVRQVHIGDSYLSSADPRVHLGIGNHDKISKLIINWPDGSIAIFENIAAGEIVVAD